MRITALKFLGTALLLILFHAGMGQKTDKVFLKNGDVLTGEIKNMKLAKLKFNMNGPGIIYIKWEEIIRMASDKIFELGLRNGKVLVSKLDTVLFENQHVSLNEIVDIVQIEKGFSKRLEGDVNLGFSYAKSSDITQFNFASSILYRKPKLETGLTLNNVISRSSSDTITSRKQDVTAGILKTLNKRFYLMSNLGWEENTQLGLENRYLLTAGGGKILINNNHQRLLIGTGLSYNNEKTAESIGYMSSLEALATIQYKRFRYSSPKISISTQCVVYPSLSDLGRVRINLQVNTSIEVFKDFFTGFTFYDNFDNRKASGGLSQNDYGITFTVGYEFGK